MLLLLRAVPVTLRGKPLRTEPRTLRYASRPFNSIPCRKLRLPSHGGPVFRMTAVSLFVEDALYTHGCDWVKDVRIRRYSYGVDGEIEETNLGSHTTLP
jgi:hypothetical protein